MAMPKIEFRCQMFRGDWDQVWSQRRMLWLMEALVRVNQTHLQEFEAFVERGLLKNNYPSVYRSGLHYETEKGTEIWPDIPSMLMGTMGKGVYPGPWSDCEDLACYRTAELRELAWHYERPLPSDPSRTEVADPRFPQEPSAMEASSRKATWPGWKQVKGGIRAKPFAKWRRGPQGQYHYHALTYLPDGRLEDPSLVLGMGTEAEFHNEGMAQKLKDGAPVVIKYAKKPDVMVVDPEKPSGYNGGISKDLDQKVLDQLKKTTGLSGEQLEIGAYLANPVGSAHDPDEITIDQLIGWNADSRLFMPRNTKAEVRRMIGYSSH